MNFQEEKAKTRKYLRRKQDILNMTEEEIFKYIEKYNKSIKRLEKQLVSLRETEKLSNEERERKAHEYAMKNFPELEEKYQKWLKIRKEKLKEQKK